MNSTRGYFSLVQYCPDIGRQEAANVGVVLFCPTIPFIRARMAEGNERVRKFFGDEASGDLHSNAMKTSLANRLKIEEAQFASLADFQKFVDSRANQIILTKPKPVKVTDPESELEALFAELVSHRSRIEQTPVTP